VRDGRDGRFPTAAVIPSNLVNGERPLISEVFSVVRVG
jgi:hypothetical protein